MTTYDLPSVIGAIIVVLRDVNYAPRDDVIADLECMKKDLAHVAPEAMRDRWQQLSALLNTTLPAKGSGWTKTVSALCSGAIDPKIYVDSPTKDATQDDTSIKCCVEYIDGDIIKVHIRKCDHCREKTKGRS